MQMGAKSAPICFLMCYISSQKNPMNCRYLPVIVVLFLTIIQPLSSQNTNKQIPLITLSAPDETSLRAAQDREPLIAVPIPVDIAPQTSGVWEELPNGDRIWQVEIMAPGAVGLALLTIKLDSTSTFTGLSGPPV